MSDLRKLISNILAEEYQSHTFEPVVGDIVANDNPKCKHRGSIGKVLSVQPLPDDQGKTATYKCMNSGDSWDPGDILTKTLDQLVPAVSEDFAYHINNGLGMTESVYRPGSSAFFDVVREFRTLSHRGAYLPSYFESYYLRLTLVSTACMKVRRFPLTGLCLPMIFSKQSTRAARLILTIP